MSEFDGSPSPGAARTPQWRLVDEGWGRKAVDMATLHEPQNMREYAAVHGRLGVGSGTRLLDIACGAGLAVELASAYGAGAAGIEAHRDWSRSPGTGSRMPTSGWATCASSRGPTRRSTW